MGWLLWQAPPPRRHTGRRDAGEGLPWSFLGRVGGGIRHQWWCRIPPPTTTQKRPDPAGIRHQFWCQIPAPITGAVSGPLIIIFTKVPPAGSYFGAGFRHQKQVQFPTPKCPNPSTLLAIWWLSACHLAVVCLQPGGSLDAIWVQHGWSVTGGWMQSASGLAAAWVQSSHRLVTHHLNLCHLQHVS